MTKKPKPDVETESFRAWAVKPTKKEKANFNKDKRELPMIDLGNGNQFVLQGFNVAYRKRDDKPLLAYKFKHEANMILIWKADDNTDEDNLLCDDFFEKVRYGRVIGYDIVDTKVWAKENIGSQLHMLDKLGKKKK